MKPSYQAALDWLFSTQNLGIKLGLENFRFLLNDLGNPEKDLRCIHVAGTNGKGSVCAMLESVIRAAGLKTGLFTSPHLVRFNERIQVNGVPVEDEYISTAICRLRSLIDPQRHSTFFEITTAISFEYFKDSKVDIAVLETGLGGRLDATNVVTPAVSVLTVIDLDHQKILGPTKAAIAEEKAGIIKPNVPVVSDPQCEEVRAVIDRVAASNNSPLFYVDKPCSDYVIGLAGSHQKLNAAIVAEALKQAHVPVAEQALRKGLQCVSWPGRFQQIRDRIILDGAHNPQAAKQLVATWTEYFGQQKASVIFGGLLDKDLSGVIGAISQIAQRFALVPIQNSRSPNPVHIRNLIPPEFEVETFSSVPNAFAAALNHVEPVLVTGSLFLVGEVLALLDPKYGKIQNSD
ncbi:MAG: bifunctional folylpolyglutamate synthase/dihydrofolate synthase, partial [Verrucomicrobia bacterium]|nr:bifunctional folylpolyglutamate synthase/dihydrofolate synthase [Verrucomicrobiota bacterium]